MKSFIRTRRGRCGRRGRLTAIGRWLPFGALVALFAASSNEARAYDFSLSLNTIGQGYQERRYSAGGASELLSRRRLTQYLNLSVFAIEPEGWRDDQRERNQISFELGMRFESDLGQFMLGRPRGPDAIAELTQNQMDVLFAYFLGRSLWGSVDVQLGRQVHYDRVDFYSFDGIDALLRATSLLSARLLAGTEVRGELPLSAPIYESDGTSVGSRDPATRPEQSRAWRPMVGGGLLLDGSSAPIPITAQAMYRRVFSDTFAAQVGDPTSGINHETVSMTADAHWGQRIFVTAGARYNLLAGLSDDQQLAARVSLGHGHFVSAEYSFLAPTFDGDSIWNVFAAGAHRDWRAGYDLPIGDGGDTRWRIHARAFWRTFVDPSRELSDVRAVGRDATGGKRAFGCDVGLQGRSQRARLRLDLYADGGMGGRKTGGDVSGRWMVDARYLELEGRATAYAWASDDLPQLQTAVIGGLGVGAIYKMSPKIRLHVLAEDNRGTYYRAQVRGLAVLEVDVSL